MSKTKMNIFEILKWTTMNPLQDQTERGSADPRRGTSKRFINRTLASMYSKNCLVNTDEFYGIVVLKYKRDVGSINLPHTVMSSMAGDPPNDTSNHNVYKVYVPELECRPYPQALNDPILATYQDVVESAGLDCAVGNIVRIQYGDLGNMKNPRIVGKEGRVPADFLPSKMEHGLHVDFQENVPAIAQSIAPYSGPSPNADRLREFIEPNFQIYEKETELTSGGDLKSDIVNATISILSTILFEISGITIKLSAGNDLFHQTTEAARLSRHRKGNAVDFTISPNDGTTVDRVEKILQRYAAGNNKKFRYLNEYTDPTAHATGKHFHISWGLGSEGNTALWVAEDLAARGEIEPLSVGGVESENHIASLSSGVGSSYPS